MEINELLKEVEKVFGKGCAKICMERLRQKEVEGWTPEHDAQHENQELVLAAVCYATPSDLLEFNPDGFFGSTHDYKIPKLWPWDEKWYKPSPDTTVNGRLRELEKSGALVASEYDRISD